MPELGAPQLTFPKIREFVLRRFSLYSKRKEELRVSFTDGVFCLAGANGLGKSTFLNALNFGLTGRVPRPGKKFESDDEYFDETEEFVSEYFTGRIEERDRNNAEVSILMDIGPRTYHLTRGLFERGSLRVFQISTQPAKSKKRTVVLNTKSRTPARRNHDYQLEIVKDIGLATFAQFVFLQHFVFTFDERRHLLFWNPKELEAALYLTFNLDFAEAIMATKLRRDMEKADSRVRNLKWQQTQLSKRIKELQGNSQTEADTETRKRYNRLINKREAATRVSQKIEARLRDQTTSLTNLAVKQIAAKAEYEKLFHNRLRNRVSLRSHPLIVSSNEQEKCGLCGSEGSDLVMIINERASASDCPLCASPIHVVSDSKDKKALKELRSLDETLMQIGSQIQEVVHASERLQAERDDAQKKERTALIQIDKFEKANSEVLTSLKKGKDTSLDNLIESFEKRFAELEEKRQSELSRRNSFRKALRQLRGRLVEKYRAAETHFLPLFCKLAREFLGIDLDVKIDEVGGAGGANVGLVISVRESTRRSSHELSESQRLFVDIALRMAIAQYISSPAGRATLFIDTPEGSLDIAYENRAGTMIGDFALSGHPVVMTANINTSQLLQVLAERLTSKHMVLSRMTTWAALSEVQTAEESLFNAAYREIEQRLKGRR